MHLAACAGRSLALKADSRLPTKALMSSSAGGSAQASQPMAIASQKGADERKAALWGSTRHDVQASRQ